mmetsp:Transcript_20031/g.55730  ORF Transcript_20031/g.55730 Transcript_20031/m.55730 type:complete len:125 (-) Transcript_20031:37-411(-)
MMRTATSTKSTSARYGMAKINERRDGSHIHPLLECLEQRRPKFHIRILLHNTIQEIESRVCLVAWEDETNATIQFHHIATRVDGDKRCPRPQPKHAPECCTQTSRFMCMNDTLEAKPRAWPLRK